MGSMGIPEMGLYWNSSNNVFRIMMGKVRICLFKLCSKQCFQNSDVKGENLSFKLWFKTVLLEWWCGRSGSVFSNCVSNSAFRIGIWKARIYLFNLCLYHFKFKRNGIRWNSWIGARSEFFKQCFQNIGGKSQDLSFKQCFKQCFQNSDVKS